MQNEIKDEIDIVEFFSCIFLYKKHVFLFTSVIVISVLVVSLFLPKYYLSEASFFVNSSKGAVPGSLGAYSALLGSMDSEVENRIEEVIKSRSMETVLTEAAVPFFPACHNLDEVKKELNFKKNFKFKKTAKSLFTIKFESQNPELSVLIVQDCLKQIYVFNEKLGLS